MRTMYIILSWIGWGWLLIAGSFVAAALHRQRRHARSTPGAEADVRP
jgi:hypothetical protein